MVTTLPGLDEAKVKPQGSIKIRADLLAEAVTAVVPRRKWKPYPLSLVYFAEDKALEVKEAYHALRGYRVTTTTVMTIMLVQILRRSARL